MTEDVAGYRVLERVGEGGFSVVYRAHQERLDRLVALKVLSTSAVDDRAMKRFQRECKIMGRLTGHPNVVTVLDVGVTKTGRPYIAMEYFEHGSLSDRLDEEGPLPVADVLRIGVKMSAALAATHETDVLHRDVKPPNILISRYGEPALTDFGIAQLVDSFDATHTSAFTPNHAAPEVLEGRPPGVASDLYSLGSTLYQLLAGRPAFEGPRSEGLATLMLRILNDAPPPIRRDDLPPKAFEVIVQTMAKNPDHRFPNAVALAQRLQRVQTELGLPVTDLAHSGPLPAPESERPPTPHTPDLVDRPAPRAWIQGPGFPGPATPYSGFPPAASVAQVPAAFVTPDVGLAPYTPFAPPEAGTGSPAHGVTSPTERHPQAGTVPEPRGQAPAETGGPRRGLIIAGTVALVGGLALGITGIVAFGGKSTPRTEQSTPHATAPSAPTAGGQARFTPAEVDAARPRAVTATPLGNGTSVRLRWKLSRGNRFPLLVKERDRPTPITLDFGTTTTIVGNLRAGSPHCFTVGTLLAFNPKPQYAMAHPVCTR
ncbi:MAG: serine/threonine protein kinase [Actinomycetia bacterium]|nr:serine/threonine protein kinase [Actinomycetes bacterium]